MLTIVVGISTFMSRKNSILGLSYPEKSLITSGPVRTGVNSVETVKCCLNVHIHVTCICLLICFGIFPIQKCLVIPLCDTAGTQYICMPVNRGHSQQS